MFSVAKLIIRSTGTILKMRAGHADRIGRPRNKTVLVTWKTHMVKGIVKASDVSCNTNAGPADQLPHP